MTRDQFVEKFRHEVDGWVLDAAMGGRSGAELSVFLRRIRAKIEEKLGVMYDDLARDQKVANGATPPAQATRPKP